MCTQCNQLYFSNISHLSSKTCTSSIFCPHLIWLLHGHLYIQVYLSHCLSAHSNLLLWLYGLQLNFLPSDYVFELRTTYLLIIFLKACYLNLWILNNLPFKSSVIFITIPSFALILSSLSNNTCQVRSSLFLFLWSRKPKRNRTT